MCNKTFQAGDMARLKSTGQIVRIMQGQIGKSSVVIVGIPIPGGNATAKLGTFKATQCAIDLLEAVDNG